MLQLSAAEAQAENEHIETGRRPVHATHRHGKAMTEDSVRSRGIASSGWLSAAVAKAQQCLYRSVGMAFVLRQPSRKKLSTCEENINKETIRFCLRFRVRLLRWLNMREVGRIREIFLKRESASAANELM